MGLMTLAQYRSDLEAGLQRSSVGNTLLDRWLHWAIEEVAYGVKFPELESTFGFTTVQGDYDYQIGAGLDINVDDFRAIHSLGLRMTAPNTRLGKLIPETRDIWLKKVGDLTDATLQGAIKYYHRYGHTLYVRPVPDDTLVTVLGHYWAKITRLVDDTDVTQFSSDWDEVWLVGALYRGFRHFGEFDRYQNVRNDFLGLVRTRVAEDDLEEFPEGGINIAQDEQDLVDL